MGAWSPQLAAIAVGLCDEENSPPAPNSTCSFLSPKAVHLFAFGNVAPATRECIGAVGC